MDGAELDRRFESWLPKAEEGPPAWVDFVFDRVPLLFREYLFGFSRRVTFFHRAPFLFYKQRYVCFGVSRQAFGDDVASIGELCCRIWFEQTSLFEVEFTACVYDVHPVPNA